MKSKSMMTWNQQWGHRNSCLCSSPNLVSCSVCVLVYFFSSLLWTVPHLHTHFPKFSLIISTNAQLPSCGAYYNPGGPEKYHCVAALSTFILMFINAHVFVQEHYILTTVYCTFVLYWKQTATTVHATVLLYYSTSWVVIVVEKRSKRYFPGDLWGNSCTFQLGALSTKMLANNSHINI